MPWSSSATPVDHPPAAVWSFVVWTILLDYLRSAASPRKESAVDLLALLGLTYLIRRLRRREHDGTSTIASPIPYNAISSDTVATRATLVARPANALLPRAACGLLLVGLLAVLTLLPWPTGWATSAALAPAVQLWRLWIIANLDVLTVSLVVFAILEPLLSPLLGALWHTPRLLRLLIRLLWIYLHISYWRYRNWRRGPAWGLRRSS
jgi:hypothetical protein